MFYNSLTILRQNSTIIFTRIDPHHNFSKKMNSFACFFINADKEEQRFRVTDECGARTLEESLSVVHKEWSLNPTQQLVPISCHSDFICDYCLQQMDKDLLPSPMKIFGGWVRVQIE